MVAADLAMVVARSPLLDKRTSTATRDQLAMQPVLAVVVVALRALPSILVIILWRR